MAMDILQGTLDLMVLKALHALGPLHGYGIARRLEQLTGEAISLNQGTIYPALVRLQQQGWIAAEWGTSENGRRAKYYAVTPLGVSQLTAQTEEWSRMVGMMSRVLDI
jgi:PadR family transcriptional regulator PadR